MKALYEHCFYGGNMKLDNFGFEKLQVCTLDGFPIILTLQFSKDCLHSGKIYKYFGKWLNFYYIYVYELV